MLAYVYRPLKKEDYRKVSAEEFDNILSLLSRIIVLGSNRLIKQGFFKDYIRKTETSSSIRGKINISESIKTLSCMIKQLNFTYNDYSINNPLNQIIKTTLLFLIKSDEVERDTKKDIKRILLYFSQVDSLDVKTIDWNIRYYRNNQEYEMLINFCRLAIEGLLQTEEDGSYKLMHFGEEYMETLYEKFIFNYFEKEYKNIISVKKSHLKWPLDKEEDNEKNLLPRMETDIVLFRKTDNAPSRKENKYLIIDAKYYGDVFNQNEKIKSENLYQIFTYVKSKEFNLKKDLEDGSYEVSGMLLYAGTKNIKNLKEDYTMDGNKISVQTLDLNNKFEVIKKQLDAIADDFLKNN